MKILVVDDNQEARYMLELLMKSNGHEVISAVNGLDALKKLEQTNFDLIISDILMPEMDGFQFCQILKKDDVRKNIPFIFYTATYVDKKDEEFGLNLGADLFLKKPMEPTLLLQEIEKIHEKLKTGKFSPSKIILKREEDLYKLYNERLIKKLEDKIDQLEKEVEHRLRTENELQRSEQRFKVLTENSPVGIFRTDSEGLTTYVNPRWSEISGLSAQEAMGEGWLAAVHPDDREKLSVTWKQATMDHKISVSEYRFILKDGTIHWVLGQAVPKKDQENNIVGYIGTITDITERKRAEKALHESEMRFSAFMETLPITAFIKTADHTVLYVNSEMKKRFGADDWIEKSLFDIFPQDVAKRLADADNKALKNGYSIDVHVLPDSKNRNRIWETHTFRIDREDQEPYIAGFSLDITDRKQAEKKIKESEMRYRTLFDTAGDAIFMMKRDRFVTCNESTIQMFGCDDKKDILEHSPWEFSPPFQPDGQDSKEKALSYINAALEGETQLFYWKHIKKDDTPFDAEVSLNKLTLEDTDYIQAVVRDITQNKKLENELKDSELRYRTLFENSSEFLFTLDIKGNFTDVNKAAEILTGYTKSELLKMNFRDYTSKKDQRKLFRAFHGVYQTGEPIHNLLVEAIIKDGSKRYFEISISLLRKGEEIIGVQGLSLIHI